MNFINKQNEDMPSGAAQSHEQPMVEKSIADGLAARVAELEAVLRGYEKWEGELVLSQEAWRGGMASLPTLTQPLFDRLIELQTMRNKYLPLLGPIPETQDEAIALACEVAFARMMFALIAPKGQDLGLFIEKSTLVGKTCQSYYSGERSLSLLREMERVTGELTGGEQ